MYELNERYKPFAKAVLNQQFTSKKLLSSVFARVFARHDAGFSEAGFLDACREKNLEEEPMIEDLARTIKRQYGKYADDVIQLVALAIKEAYPYSDYDKRFADILEGKDSKPQA